MVEVKEFMAVAEGAIQGALEGFLKSLKELDQLPRPLFKLAAQRIGKGGEGLFPLIRLGVDVSLIAEVRVSGEYCNIEKPRYLILGLFIEPSEGGRNQARLYLEERVANIQPERLRGVAPRIFSQLSSETPKEALRVVEGIEAWAERARGLLREVEAEYAATLEGEKEALEALRLRAAIRGLAEE
jgi:hypothetical protein